ncbi:anti-sigma factor domain-containing protein [uncultured Croceitalea sp.]|uniref:anti-sigma factor domain-containing protein n=1 Tax=uncultured Croceitalea sp. TaxID=1798908 RepID=UPI00374EB748
MERKKILDEGLLEKYLLDELNDSDRTIVERAIISDEVLKKQFSELEADFEKMALENAIVPPTHVKNSIKEQLEPAIVKRLSNTPLLVAASIGALFFFSSIWMYTQWQNTKNEFESLQSQTTDLKERLNILEENYVLTNTRLKTIDGKNTVPLLLKGNELSPNSRAIAYVNHKKKMVVVNSEGLPKLPKDKTYQMWSDVDGEMIDMGVLKSSEELITLKYIDKAESLNITIEPTGGNDHPTVENLISYVIL